MCCAVWPATGQGVALPPHGAGAGRAPSVPSGAAACASAGLSRASGPKRCPGPDAGNAPLCAMTPPRGAAPVGYVSDLAPVEAHAVLTLRRWCDGPAEQARVRAAFADALGVEGGQSAVQSFETLCTLCVSHGRRPLMRHGVACHCLGADEACFAVFVGYASDGAREDALLMASMLVHPAFAPSLVGCAETFGLALRRMALKSCEPTPKATRLH